jgi:hypothetical protein
LPSHTPKLEPARIQVDLAHHTFDRSPVRSLDGAPQLSRQRFAHRTREAMRSLARLWGVQRAAR